MSPEEVKATIYKLWREGQTSGDIARTLGITRSKVMGCVNRAQRMGLLSKRPYPIKKEKPAPQAKPAPVPVPVTKPVTLAVVSIQTKEPEMPRKRPEPVKQPELPLHRPKRIMELTTYDCRWIRPDGKYCAVPARSARTPWCEEHYHLVYVPTPKKLRA